MKALTIRQPYAYAILYYGKDIENCSGCTSIRRTIAIHAGAQLFEGVYLPEGFKKQSIRSAIIGIIDILDRVDDYESPWFFGPFGYLLDDPRPLVQPIPSRGQLGFWNLAPEIERENRKQPKGKI